MSRQYAEYASLVQALPESLQHLASAGAIRRFPKRTRFITEGEPGNSVYLLLSGRAKVFSSDLDGKEVIYGHYGPGAILGEMALDGQPRSASVEAVTDVIGAVISTDLLRERIAADADFAMSLIMTLIGRSRNTTVLSRRLALENAYGRLAALLRELAVEQEGAKVIPEPMSQQDIADRIGTSRDMVSKIFKELAKGEYLSYAKKRITLLRELPRKW